MRLCSTAINPVLCSLIINPRQPEPLLNLRNSHPSTPVTNQRTPIQPDPIRHKGKNPPMNLYNSQPYPFTGPSFQSSGTPYPRYPPSGSFSASGGSVYYAGPQGQQIPTYQPTPGAVSQPVNIPWQLGTQHWSQSGLTGPEPRGGIYFNYVGGPGSFAPPANPGGPGWTTTGHPPAGGAYYIPE